MSPIATPGTATTVQETVNVKKPKIQHPLDPLTSDEVRIIVKFDLENQCLTVDSALDRSCGSEC